MKIAMANSGGHHPHRDFTRSRREDLDGLENERFLGLVEDGGEGLHGKRDEMMFQ